MSYIIVGAVCVVAYIYREKLWDYIIAMWKDDQPDDK